MRRPLAPSRSRRIAKWTGLVVSVVILAMWAVSTQVEFGYQFSELAVGAAGRRMFIVSFQNDFTGWFAYASNYEPDTYLPEIKLEWGSAVRVAIPLWMPFVLAAISTAILWRRDRRTPTAGLCRMCGYDLRASKDKCPECGTPHGLATPIKPPPA